MASGQWVTVLRHVQRLFQGGSVAGLSEGQLLDRFLATRDEVAFGAIVARHGPMVLGVCRGILHDSQDVEDAFQATFLILVNKARGLRDRDLLGPWLYGVARRVSLRARADATRRRQKESPDAQEPIAADSTLDAELRELQTLIREEVDRLSNHDRMAVVLCYLEGLTHEEAADRLGWPIGTVKGRLSRAREKLKTRLSRRGVTLPTVFVSALDQTIPNLVPTSLLQTTILAASRLASGQTLTAGIVSAQAIHLMEGVIGTMFASQFKIAATTLAATFVLAVPGVLAYQGLNGTAQPQVQGFGRAAVIRTENLEAQPEQQKSEIAVPATESEAKICEEALKFVDQQVSLGMVDQPVEQIYRWSRRMVEAYSGPTVADADRKAALNAHLDRMKKSLTLAQARVEASRATGIEVLEARFRVIEAERWSRLGRITSGMVPPFGNVGTAMPMGGMIPPVSPTAGVAQPGLGGPGVPLGGGGFGGQFGGADVQGDRDPLFIKQTPADEKRNQAIHAKLDEPIDMDFSAETPLEEVKKYLAEKTVDKALGLPNGIPIYVDPEGLQDADKTMANTIQISLHDIPLRTTLRLLLRQLGLNYRVVGGLLLISDETSIQSQDRMEKVLGAAK